MNKQTKNTLAGIALATSGILATSTRADDTIKEEPKSALESALEGLSMTSRGYADGHGNYQTHQLVSSDMAKIAYRGESGANIYGFDGKVGNMRLNIGYQDFLDTKVKDNSRVEVEYSFDKTSILDFANVEVQDNAGERQVAGATGLRLGNFKPQVTFDDDSNYGYGLIWDITEKSNIGIGGHNINDSNTFNTALSHRWTSEGILQDYKVLGQAKVFDTATSHKGIEARIRFGDKTPGGGFLAGVQDTLFNSITPFLGGDGDATFPFGIGDGNSRIDFFGAASSNSGKIGRISFDVKYHDEETLKFIKEDVAVGLGSVTDSFLKHNIVQIGNYHDFSDSKNDFSNLELRTTIYESKNKDFSVDLGVRDIMPREGKNEYSAMVSATINF